MQKTENFLFMTNFSCCRLTMLISAALSLTTMPSQAQSTAFTYQGRLNDGANPASGFYDLRCSWEKPTAWPLAR